MFDNLDEVYEVEKIINIKFEEKKKYYLIKWFGYPINESTWEPKSNLINLNYLIDQFEEEYPNSIDNDMYKIYCDELKRKVKRGKNTKKTKKFKNNSKFLSKKKKIEGFTKSELKGDNLYKLQIHLHLNLTKRHMKIKENELIIDLSSNTSQSEETLSNEELIKEDSSKIEENIINKTLIKPEIE